MAPTKAEAFLRVERGIPDRDIPERNDFHHLLYPRGYCLVPEEISLDVPAHWKRLSFAGHTLHWDPRNTLAIAEGGSCGVALVGRAIDLDSGENELGTIAMGLLHALQQGRSTLHARLDSLCGRYVVIDHGPSGTWLQTDASGLRSAFYAVAGRYVASHAALAAAASNAQRRKLDPAWFQLHKAYALPGHITEWEGVNLLTPNLELNLLSGSLSRIGPYREDTQAPEAVAEQLLPQLQTQLTSLSKTADLMISLTAGLDSRTTFCLSRPIAGQTLYFTYTSAVAARGGGTLEDLALARKLCERFALRHQTVVIERNIEPGPLLSVMNQNHGRSHVRSLAPVYRRTLPTEGLHIRSNLYEIGRAWHYHGKIGKLPPLDAKRMTWVVQRDRTSGTSGWAERHFEEWGQATGINDVAGFDRHDLFYWEFRMARWLGSVVTESDIAHDTWILVNCRRILRQLLSTPLSRRVDNSVFQELMVRSWPEALALPVNGKMTPQAFNRAC